MMNPAEFANIAQSEENFWWYRGMREILFRMLDPIAEKSSFERVAEAGCGTGHLTKILAERYGWNMFPLDIGREGLEYARNYGVTQSVQGNITALPFENGSFDALLSIDVLPHLERGQESAAFAEFARVLRPGGLLVIRTAAFDFLRSRHSVFVHEKQRFTRGQLVGNAEASGFKAERVTFANSLLLPVSVFKFRVWEPLTRAEPNSGVLAAPAWLDALLSVPMKIEAAWIGSGGMFPVGQSLLLIARKSVTP